MDLKELWESAKGSFRPPKSFEELRLLAHQYVNVSHSLFFVTAWKQLKKHRKFFDTVQSQPLTLLQRLAVLLNERRNLIVAGAGTGKTSVVTAKVAYLTREGLARPEELLLLAYNDRARKEMQERLRLQLGLEVTVRTFHSLGNEILGDVLGEKPPLHKMADGTHKVTYFLSKTLEELLNDECYQTDLVNYFSNHLKPFRPPSQFSSEREYRAYLRSLELKTLQGDRVKSHGELDVANFMFCSGVSYEYEASYKGTVPKNRQRRAYQPDFYLPDYNLYIEYFGIDREGNTAPWIDKEQYQRDIAWKRNVHEKNGTRLLEIESYHRQEGQLQAVLSQRLAELGVRFQPRSPQEILQAVKHQGYENEFLKLVASFIEHCRSNGWNAGQLRAKSFKLPERERSWVFLRVFERFLDAYKAELKRTGTIDFSDMISTATRAIESGEWRSPYKYILIDEFQDISVGRYKLVDALLRQDEKSQLFGVGDDWQAIYRFAGSDISLMTGFRRHFGKSSVLFLDRTFRFNSAIESVSTKFITKNPRQLRKALIGTAEVKTPKVYCHWRAADPHTQIENVIDRMVSRHSPQDNSLLILARYRHDLPDNATLSRIKRIWASEAVQVSTVHKAKGTEADYVLLVDLISGKYGFPSEIVDDPLLDLVLAEPESYPVAEERRLFYVALTRARHAAHLIVAEGDPSRFALELKAPEYLVRHEEPDARYRCPRCEVGILRRFRSGSFGCTNFPDCEYIAPDCPECGNGFLWRTGHAAETEFRCSEETCIGTANACPKCGKGALVRKRGKYGDFIGCSDWQTCVPRDDR